MKLRPLLPLVALLVLSGPASAIKIDIRYDYDTNGFFDQPGAKEAMRQVADYFESLIHDPLLAIDHTQWPGNSWEAIFDDPGTGSEVSIPNLVVPADTIIIFAGGRPLGSPAGQGGFGGWSGFGFPDWFDLVEARGQAGALSTPPTDFGPWGGAITFNTSNTWNFSTTSPVNGASPFVSIALHELGHVLGIGTADSWHTGVSGGNFTGSHSVTAYGGNIPLQPGGGHWQDDGQCALPDGYDPDEPDNVLSKAFGSFEAPHGFGQIALMDPSTCSAGTFHKVMTDLDLAGLRDIGWQVAPPVKWADVQIQPDAGPFYFSWPSTSGFTYRVQKSTLLESGSWSTLTMLAGDGTVQDFTTPAPGDSRAFYRLNTDPPAAAATAVMPDTGEASQSREPVTVTDCHCGASWGCN